MNIRLEREASHKTGPSSTSSIRRLPKNEPEGVTIIRRHGTIEGTVQSISQQGFQIVLDSTLCWRDQGESLFEKNYSRFPRSGSQAKWFCLMIEWGATFEAEVYSIDRKRSESVYLRRSVKNPTVVFVRAEDVARRTKLR